MSEFLVDPFTLSGALAAAFAIKAKIALRCRIGHLLSLALVGLRSLATSVAGMASAACLAPLRLGVRAIPPRVQRAPVHALLALGRTPPARLAWGATSCAARLFSRVLSYSVVPLLSLALGASLAVGDGPLRLDGRAGDAAYAVSATARRPSVLGAFGLVAATHALGRNEGLRRAFLFNAGMVPMALDYRAAQWLYALSPEAERTRRFQELHEKHKGTPLKLILKLGGFYTKIGQVRAGLDPTC